MDERITLESENGGLLPPPDNFDELLKNNVLTSSLEEAQLLQNPSSSFFLRNFDLNGDTTTTTPQHILLHAGLINLGNNNQNSHMTINGDQQIMGIDPTAPMLSSSQHHHHQAAEHWLRMVDSNLKVCESGYDQNLCTSTAMNVDYYSSENMVGMSMAVPVPAISASSSESHATADRKRHLSDEMKEKTIERRQKRMIKNRESAARSRARKQAYTNQLEHEVFQLGKLNSWLKKQKEAEIMLWSNPTSTAKYQLRRSSSALF